MTRLEEVALATLLGHRLADGSVYLESRNDRVLLKQAVRLGLVDQGGYLTETGRRFLETRACASLGFPADRIEDSAA